MFDGVITIFNYDRKTEGYYATVLEDVEIQELSAANLIKTGPSDADTINIHIPYSEKYRKPLEWMSSDDKTEIFTFNAKNKKDFIYCGKWEDGKVISDTDYKDDFYAYMSGNYDDVYMIRTVAAYKTIPHWEVGVK